MILIHCRINKSCWKRIRLIATISRLYRDKAIIIIIQLILNLLKSKWYEIYDVVLMKKIFQSFIFIYDKRHKESSNFHIFPVLVTVTFPSENDALVPKLFIFNIVAAIHRVYLTQTFRLKVRSSNTLNSGPSTSSGAGCSGSQKRL